MPARAIRPAAVLLAATLAWMAPRTGAAQPAAPAAAAHASVTLPPALDRVLRDYERAWTARDPDALAALFAEDGFVLRTGAPPVRGRAAIRDVYRGAGGPLTLRAIDFAHAEGVGYIIGGYAMSAGTTDAGKFVLTLRRGAGGRWLISADMDNPNALMRPPG